MSQTIKKKKPIQRYFDAPNVDEHELDKVQVKKKNKQKLVGDFIKVKAGKFVKIKQEKDVKVKKEKATKKKMEPLRRPKIAKELLAKYTRGEKVNAMKGIKTKFFKEQYRRKEIIQEYVVEQAARTELLLQEEEGFLQPDEHEITAHYSQAEIAANVDILAASKHFKLKLDFGPYRMCYTHNGRDLLIGGKRGHVAAFDWMTKKLKCEMNVMEEVADISWLHVNTMFAVAQKDWLRIYDIQGTELHCIKQMHQVNRIEFLPYHFLLATANTRGYLTWLDVSIGELVANYKSRLGDIRLMRQNPANGVICIGGGQGVVSMWSPTVREPLAKILCHPTPLSALTVDPKGQYLVTAGLDKKIKIWDVRKLRGPLKSLKINCAANQVEVSQRGVLAFTQYSNIEMYNNLLMDKSTHPYLRHRAAGYVHNMRFCPYEDVLGVGTTDGFESLLVPGSGEPNFDALEANPFQTKKQRREREVHSLLEKIPAELIALNPTEISGIDEGTLQEKVEAKRSLFYLKPPKVEFKSKNKMKGRGGSVKAAHNKQIVRDTKRKEFIQNIRKAKQDVIKEHAVKNETEDFIPLVANKQKPTVLDRFKTKPRKF